MKITTKKERIWPVTFVTNKRFAALFFLPSCCVSHYDSGLRGKEVSGSRTWFYVGDSNNSLPILRCCWPFIIFIRSSFHSSGCEGSLKYMCFRLVSHLPRTKILKGLSTLGAREPVLRYRHKMVLCSHHEYPICHYVHSYSISRCQTPFLNMSLAEYTRRKVIWLVQASSSIFLYCPQMVIYWQHCTVS